MRRCRRAPGREADAAPAPLLKVSPEAARDEYMLHGQEGLADLLAALDGELEVRARMDRFKREDAWADCWRSTARCCACMHAASGLSPPRTPPLRPAPGAGCARPRGRADQGGARAPHRRRAARDAGPPCGAGGAARARPARLPGGTPGERAAALMGGASLAGWMAAAGAEQLSSWLRR